ncbi:MAG: hypothetical protein ACRD9W_23230, partial [Terriglobia bacterium]
MRSNQQDFRRRFGMNVFTVAAARATIGWLWLLIQLADLLLHRHSGRVFFPENPAAGADARACTASRRIVSTAVARQSATRA